MAGSGSDKFGVIVVVIALCLPSDVLAQKKPAGAAHEVRVPFVGCASDGQVGPLEAPKGVDQVVQIEAGAAKRLAYYKSVNGPGVLGPRGWHCFGVYGSSGGNTFVSPVAHKPSEVFSDDWKVDEPAVDAERILGSSGGRSYVAEVVARVFPTRRAFVQRIIAEFGGNESDFPFGPYPEDKLVYLSNSIVEFQTPPHTKGLGTSSWLRANDSPVNGVEILQRDGSEDSDPDLISLSVRLPKTLNDLTLPIIRQLERDNPPAKK